MALGDAVGDTKIAAALRIILRRAHWKQHPLLPHYTVILSLLGIIAAHFSLPNIDHLWPQSMQHSYATPLLQLQ